MIPTASHARQIASLLAPIAPLLADTRVTEIMINGHDGVWVERAGRLERTGFRFDSAEDVIAVMRAVAQFVQRPMDDAHPILEGRLPDGSRIEAVLPPLVADGPALCIRRFSGGRLGMTALIGNGTLCNEAANALTQATRARRNILVSGGTGSGKTSLLNALGEIIEPDERVLILEDARELQLGLPHVVQLETRPADAHGFDEITLRQLLRAALRLRPDRIVVGEIRGAEAFDLIQAMTSGHRGCMGTVHANHPRDALTRIETLALMSDVGLPLSTLRNLIASAIDVVAHVVRGRDGGRRVTHVITVDGLAPDGTYRTRSSFPETTREHD